MSGHNDAAQRIYVMNEGLSWENGRKFAKSIHCRKPACMLNT